MHTQPAALPSHSSTSSSFEISLHFVRDTIVLSTVVRLTIWRYHWHWGRMLENAVVRSTIESRIVDDTADLLSEIFTCVTCTEHAWGVVGNVDDKIFYRSKSKPKRNLESLRVGFELHPRRFFSCPMLVVVVVEYYCFLMNIIVGRVGA